MLLEGERQRKVVMIECYMQFEVVVKQVDMFTPILWELIQV